MAGSNEIDRRVPSDDDDRRLFSALVNPDLQQAILRIKHNDPEAKHVCFTGMDNLSESAWTRLGLLLGQAKYLENLAVYLYRNPLMNGAGLCVGLQSNQSIRSLFLGGINLGDEQMSSLGPFLSRSSDLEQLSLTRCNLGSAAIGFLSAALLQRSKDTLNKLDLRNNHIGDLDLEKLDPVLNRNRGDMGILYLGKNQIGSSGCDLLSKLLRSRECNLSRLDLSNNSIDGSAALALADSLAKNTRLMELNLCGNDGINSEGWLAILHLVCNTSSINGTYESNHHLGSIGMGGRQDTLHRALGVDDAHLLCASLMINHERDKTKIARRKILWSHAKGDLNIGDSSIVTGVLPRILAWIGDYSNESNATLIQYHSPPLPRKKMDLVRLDALYRVVQSRPDLCSRNKGDAARKKRKRR